MGVRRDHWIGGKPEEPSGGSYLPTLDPAARRPGDEVAAGTAADVDRAVAAATAAQPDWARRPGAERAEVLHRVADAVEAGADELMELERACTGKLPSQLRMEVDMSAAYFRYYAGVLRAHHGRTIDLTADGPVAEATGVKFHITPLILNFETGRLEARGPKSDIAVVRLLMGSYLLHKNAMRTM